MCMYAGVDMGEDVGGELAVLQRAGEGKRLHLYGFHRFPAEQTGRAKAKEAKARICLPMSLAEAAQFGDPARTADGRYIVLGASSIPAATLSMNVSLSLGISKADFTADKQSAFLAAMAAQFGIPRGRLRILDILETGRRLRRGALATKGISIVVAVESAPGADAASVTSAIQAAVNSAKLRNETFAIGGISVSGALASINVPGAAGAVPTGDDSAQDIQLIADLPGAPNVFGSLNATCAAVFNCTACADTFGPLGRCSWCSGACVASAFCPASLSPINDAASCSFTSAFSHRFETKTSPPDSYFQSDSVKAEFAAWFESLLGLQSGAVKILTLVRGSVNVTGEIRTAASAATAEALKTRLLQALASTTASRTIGGFELLASCPAAGCPGANGGASGSSSSNAAIIGGVVGGVGGALVLVAIVVGVWAYRKKGASAKDARVQDAERGKTPAVAAAQVQVAAHPVQETAGRPDAAHS
eukprot:tig00000385_g24738.t1